MRRALVCFLMIGFFPVVTYGWGERGHKLVAAIALQQLDAATRTRLSELLRKHPRFYADFRRRMPDDIEDAERSVQNEWIFLQGAIWPDTPRDFEGKMKKRWHRAPWHYINLPIFLTEADKTALEGQLQVNVAQELPTSVPEDVRRNLNVVQAIQLHRSIVADAQASPKDRAFSLSWLIHTVGDLHQPMHSTALFSQGRLRDGDQGGNAVQLRQGKNLHSLWDGLPGRAANGGESVQQQALRLIGVSELAMLGGQAATSLDAKAWLQESHDLAKSFAYSDEILTVLRQHDDEPQDIEIPRVDIGDDYIESAERLAERRIIQAGFRLAEILKTAP